ncbi:glycosyl hydrolase family 98 C-terminal domain-containing protein [Streptomyces sp. NPDC004542]|uniref:glycosyl hydrolase family 98 C-terminal domain-containing protein n=1 Tax=Streptomyces sp. NPDC004542 TaxID=3154281 RepID=UPI0033B7E49D
MNVCRTVRPRVRGRTTTVWLMMTALLAALLAVAPAPGIARAASGGTADAPLRLKIDQDHPLLITQLNIGHNFGADQGFRRDLNDGWSIRQTWAGLPDELKGHTAFVLHPGHNMWANADPQMARRWVEDNLAEGRDLGIPMFVLWGESPTAPSDRYDWLEKLYQTYPNFVGTVVSELTNTLNDLPKALELANRYGGFHVLGSMEEANLLGSKLEDPDYFASVKRYAQNFIFDPKNIHENFDTANAQAQGLWLSGVVGNWGPYFDGYAYYGCGIFGQGSSSASLSRGDRCSRSQPESVYAMAMLDQWQNGATVFHLENQIDVPAADSRYSPTFYQSVLPAMRYMLSHSGPTKQDVIAETPVAFSESRGTISSLPDTVASRDARTTFYDLYEKVPDALGSQGLWYYLRSQGRYGMIPRLPKLADQDLVDRFTTVLTADTYPELVAGNAKKDFFKARYPAVSRGDAFVQHRNGSWLVYNSRYWDNVRQDASFDLEGDTFTQVDLPDMTPHTFAMVDQGPGRLSMLIDDYRTDRTKDLLRDGGKRDMEFIDGYARYAYIPHPADDELRTTTVRVHARTRPVPTISGYDGHYTYTQEWDENTHVFTLTLKHNGVVNVDLTTGPTTKGWTHLTSGSDQVTRTAKATEAVFDGTSVQWSAEPGSIGSARVLIDGKVYEENLDLAGAAGGHPFRATGLPGGPHTLRVEGRGIRTRGVDYVPSTLQMLPDVETADFSYGSAEDDQDTVYGSDKWRVADGQLALLPYVFPFFGDVSVYNTNARAEDVVYEAKMTLRKGTSGALMLRGNERDKTSYLLRLDPNRVGEGERAPATTGDVQLILDHATTLAVNTSIDLVTGRQYDVRFQAVGDRVQAWIDGQQVIDYTVTSAQRRGEGYTGVRIGSRNGGGFGDEVLVDDVRVSRPDGTELYRSDFADWAAAKGWRTETALVFDAKDTRSDFSFPWRWREASGDWQVVNTDAFTNGDTGYFTGTADKGQGLVTAGLKAPWAGADAGYLYSSALRVDKGDGAGLLLRVQDDDNLYRVALDAGHDRVTFDRRVKGEWENVAKADVPGGIGTGTWHILQVGARGELFTVTLDGNRVLTARDRTFQGGGVGYWLPRDGSASFDDARVAALPDTPAAGPVLTEVVRRDGTAGRHITGFDPVGVKTAKDSAPELPDEVTALYSDGTSGKVHVSWPDIPADQLAVATTPYADGQSRGRFTVEGQVEGTGLTVPVLVTVMPKLSSPLRTTLAYDPAHPALPAQTFTGVRFDAGGGVTFTRQVYVRWDQAITVSADGAHEQQLTGTIADHPWEKATADVTLAGS